ncbi:MAG TPA: hypothetical protein PLC80_04310 [Draconibacterium sp.]|nr:hypothetical protein [Draconibacterium sp.]
MANTSNTGHPVNLANFNLLNEIYLGYGEDYNPGNNLIKPAAMQELAAVAAEAQRLYTATFPALKTAIVERKIVFKPLSRLVSKTMFFLKGSGAPKEIYDKANTVARLIKGIRASKKIKPEPVAEGEEPAPVPKQISASHMSFDSRISNFGIFIQMLAGIPQYNPNENELKIESLWAVHDGLKAKNSAFIAAEVPNTNARIARNKVFYTELTGLCDVGQASKDYVKALYGINSPRFKQISKIRFTRPR